MGLTTNGLIFMVLAWTIIISMVIYAFYKVFHNQRKN